jgi:hypothetical protein
MIEEQAVTGRTPWDFATELLIVLGRIGPAAIIVAGFLIISLLFYQEINEVKSETDKLVRERTEFAQKQLVETYQTMGGMSSQLINNIGNLLKLRREIDVEIGNMKAEVDASGTRVKRLKAQIVNHNLASILYQGMRNDINTLVDESYLPYMRNLVLRMDSQAFKDGDMNTMFGTMESVVKHPNNYEAKANFGKALEITMKKLIEAAENYRQEMLDPLNQQEKSVKLGILDDDALENLRNTSIEIAEITKSKRPGGLQKQADEVMRIFTMLESK